MIEIHDLVRLFDRKSGEQVRALDGLTMSIDRGTVHGLLGPNGAGKTTLTKVLSTMLLPTSGSATIDGLDVAVDVDAVRRTIGVVLGGERGLYTRVSARRNLLFWSAMHRMSRKDARRRADVVLERVGLLDRANDLVETYSRGMKQRLHLARALLHDPDVLFFDEPTTGMDPSAALEFRRLIGSLRESSRTVFLTTHDMAEAESVCDRVSLIDRGQLLFSENPRSLRRFLGEHHKLEFQLSDESEIERLGQVRGLIAHGDAMFSAQLKTVSERDHLVARLIEIGAVSFRSDTPTLEDVYMHFVGERGFEV